MVKIAIYWVLFALVILLIATPSAQAFGLNSLSLKKIMAKVGLGESALEYEIEFAKIEPSLADELDLEKIAHEAIDENNPPQNLDELSAISGLMAARLSDFLSASGYYDARARANLQLNEKQKTPPIITFEINLGKQYKFAQHKIIWEDAPSNPDDLQRNFPKTVERGGLKIGEPFNNQMLLDIAADIRNRLMKNHCYLTLEVTPTLMLDRLHSSATVKFKIKHGGEANFGATNFSGQSDVKSQTLQNYVTWKQGECFAQSKINSTTSQMLQSRLLARANIEVEEEKIADGQVLINIGVIDRPHKSVTAGGSFATDEKLGVKLGWEHRNLYGKAHRLSTKLNLNALEKSVTGQYTVPFFRQKNQNLQLSSSLLKQNTSAFDSTNISVLGAIERYIINPKWLVGAGGGMRISSIKDVNGSSDFSLIYTPIFMQWDSRDDLFNAQEGIFTRGSISPYLDFSGNGANFLKTDITSNIYLNLNQIYNDFSSEPIITNPIDEQDYELEQFLPYSPIVAVRLNYGQINGAGRSSIPADLRFYAGGGGSVRGYNFQAIGKRAGGLPAGGTVHTEINAELRLRFNQQFGAVTFLDAGAVYDGNIFNPSEQLFLGAGAGVRYFSPIGPIRFDIGVPLEQVEDDISFGTYISIGQAF